MNEVIEQTATLLVVEDNEDNRLIAATNLEMAGYTVLQAEDGERGLEALGSTAVDLVLLDIMMPGIDGYEVCRRIRASASLQGVKVLMLTAKADTRDLVKGFEVGADDYVTKPFEIQELISRVRNLVGLKRAEDELRRINTDLEDEVLARSVELARSEARYRAIFNAVPISIMLLDEVGRIKAVNAWHEQHPLFDALYAGPLVGARLTQHPGAAKVGIEHHLAALLTGADFEHQSRVALDEAEKTTAVVRARGVPIRSAGGTVQGALVLHEDLTKETEIQQRLLGAQKLASLCTLAQGVAHNFNNLLFVVSGSLEILRSALDRERYERPLKQARTALSRMAALTRQLAVFSHLGERGCQPVDLRQVLQDVADSFRTTLPQGVGITVEAADDLPRLSGRTNEMFQLFHGLVQNAIEAMPDGGQVCLSMALEPRVLHDPNGPVSAERPCLVCEVSDTGIGMDEEVKRRAFEPFFTSKQTVGVGLGLSAAHGIVRSCGGLIEIISAPGQGTRVIVILPAGDEAQPDAVPSDPECAETTEGAS